MSRLIHVEEPLGITISYSIHSQTIQRVPLPPTTEQKPKPVQSVLVGIFRAILVHRQRFEGQYQTATGNQARQTENILGCNDSIWHRLR